MHNSSHSPEAHPAPGGDEPVISVAGLAKEYRVFDKPEGLGASIRGLFRRTSRTVEALRGVSLEVGREIGRAHV